MAVRPIRKYGDPALRETSQLIEATTPEIRRLAEDMIDTMIDAQGIGLAAPQHRPQRNGTGINYRSDWLYQRG